jgi:hypothetical protein
MKMYCKVGASGGTSVEADLAQSEDAEARFYITL